MSVWRSRVFPRPADDGTPRRRASARRRGPSRPPEADDVPLLVEEHDGLFVLSSPLDETLGPADVADLVRGLRTREQVATLIAGAHAGAAPGFWPRLGELLGSLTAAGTTAVRLAAGGAGDHGPDRPAVAAGIADDWGITVDAPAGAVLAIPGGSLFVPTAAGAPGGWWRFAPGAAPVPLGPRCPAPSWQAALGRAPTRTSGGCVVHQIPAGLLIRPAEAAAPEPHDLFHAVPVDPRRPAVVVGVPFGEDVSAEEVADLLATVLPDLAGTVRLVPGGHDDLLPLGRRVADLSGAEVEVSTGLPLFATSRPLDSYAARSVLIGADGSPAWLPFVDTVLCRPSGEGAAAAPRLLRWSPPLPGKGSPEKGAVRLTDRWQVTVTRAGLWVSTLDSAPSPHRALQARQVSTAGPAIEVGTPGRRLDSSLWPALSRLFRALTGDLRACATVYVHGTTSDGGRALRQLAMEHGLRTVRYTADAAGPRLGAAPRTPVPASVPAPGPAREPAQIPPAPGPSRAAGPAVGPPPAPEGPGTDPATAPRRGQKGETKPWPSAGPVSGPPAATRTGPDSPSSPDRGADDVSPPSRVSFEPLPDTAERGGPARPASASGASSAGRPDTEGGRATSADAPDTPAPTSAPTPASASPGPDHVTGEEGRSASFGDLPERTATDPADHEPEAGSARPGSGARSAPRDVRERTPAPDAGTRTNGDPRPTTQLDPSSRHAAATPAGAGADPPRRPVRPGSRSTEGERSAFADLVESVGLTSSGAVDRALDALSPSRAVRETSRADLTAMTAYLGDPDGPLSHGELTRALRTGDDRFDSYAACLASGLQRMPTYQGLVLRGTGTEAHRADGLRPGDQLADRAPVSAVAPHDGPPLPGGACYAVWSVTGRRVRQLADDHDDHDEVVFLAGTSFRLLDIRVDNASPLLLLRELPSPRAAGAASARPYAPPGLDEVDRAVLTWLNDALRGRPAPSAQATWPQRCAGPIGNGP